MGPRFVAVLLLIAFLQLTTLARPDARSGDGEEIELRKGKKKWECRKQTDECKNTGGTCVNPEMKPEVYVEKCDEYVTGICKKEKIGKKKVTCGCCIDCEKVVPSKECKGKGGKCRRFCLNGEVTFPTLCDRRCVCCVTQCVVLPACCQKNGKCVRNKEDCTNGYILVGGCTSGNDASQENCFCCVERNSTTAVTTTPPGNSTTAVTTTPPGPLPVTPGVTTKPPS